MARSGALVAALGSLMAGCCFGGGLGPAPQPAPAPYVAPHAASVPTAARAMPAPPAVSPLPAEELAANDVEPLVEHCVNGSRENVARSRQRYLQWVDPAVGPNTRGHVYGLYSVSPGVVSRCREAVTEVAQRPPVLAEVDASAAAYASVLELVVPL